MPEVGASLRNVYFDSAASPFLYRPDIYPEAARLVGADHVLFASDYPLMPHSRPLAEVEGQLLADEQRLSILGGNAAGLLGIGQV